MQRLAESAAILRARCSSRGRSVALLFAMALPALATVALAQTPAPLAQPNVPLYLNGTIDAIVMQADGGVVFGGSFTSVNGIARTNLARLLPDGGLDPAWSASVDGHVNALAMDASGSIYVGGLFAHVGGQARDNLARLGTSGTLDPAWNPGANAAVQALAVDASGAIYAGGDFSVVGGTTRIHLVKIGSSGSVDANWNPAPDAAVEVLASGGGSTLYVGGDFSTIGGQTRARIARLSTAGAGNADSVWNPAANGRVRALAIDASNAIYAGGDFSTIGGQPRQSMAKLSASGGGVADPVWNPAASASVYAIVLDSSNALYAGGDFTSIGGSPARFVARLSTLGSGSADTGWAPAPDNSVLALALNPGGVLHLGGAFGRIDGVVHFALAAVSPTGTVSATASDAEVVGDAYAVVAQPDGGIVVGGNFAKADQTARSNILRLRSDGTLDSLWDASANGYVLALATDGGGSVYAGGYFNLVGGQTRIGIAKLSGTGSGAADPAWNPSADDVVYSLALGAGNTVYAGGRFSAIGGQLRSHIAKLDSTGLANPGWNPGADAEVAALAVDSTGTVYAGGEFTSIGGVARSHLAKIGNTGIVDAAWNFPADNSVISLTLAGSSVLYVGGNFNTLAGQVRAHIAKLQTAGSGSVDASWNPAANGVVRALALDATGALFAGGGFSIIGGQSRNAIAKLDGGGIGGAESSWNPGADFYVDALAVTGNQAVIVGGEFGTIGGQPRLGLASLPPSGNPVMATSTSIVSINPATTVTGQGYLVSFVVSAVSGTPAGSIDVRDDAGASCGPVTLSGGTGACSLASTSSGARVVTASYTPANVGNFSGSSVDVTHVVQRAATTLAITSHVPNPSTPSQAVVTSVMLAVSSPGSGTPTGPIAVSDGVDGCSIPQGSTSCSVALTTRGMRTLTASYAGDANFTASGASATHRVNRLPVATADSDSTNEDTVLTIAAAQGLLANDSDPDGDTLTVTNAGTVNATGIGGVVQLSANGAFTYTPPANANGIALFSYVLGDGRETTSGTVTITVVPVNDPPAFTLSASPVLPAGTDGAGSVPAFAVVTNEGPPDEAGQATSAWIVRTIADPSGVVTQASIRLDGTLDYTVTGRPGTASFGVKLKDNGGTANGGIDTSAEQTFSITVAAGADLSIGVDDGIAFVRGGQTVHYTIVVHNAGPNDVSGARVRDILPVNLTAASWTCVADVGATCTASGSGGIDDFVALANGTSATYALSATVIAIPEQPLINTVSIDAPAQTPDAHPADNSATDTDAVGIFADGFEGND
ncbi:MAG: cadherin-like domain-containing protein [Dokdonella sp.]|uniref:cadherin-like domain-containing protein n=1 Tax=Dokdonella sp. TaxID=2291710 RepID=UPI0032666B5B